MLAGGRNTSLIQVSASLGMRASRDGVKQASGRASLRV